MRLSSKVLKPLSVECPRVRNTLQDPHMCERYSFPNKPSTTIRMSPYCGIPVRSRYPVLNNRSSTTRTSPYCGISDHRKASPHKVPYPPRGIDA